MYLKLRSSMAYLFISITCLLNNENKDGWDHPKQLKCNETIHVYNVTDRRDKMSSIITMHLTLTCLNYLIQILKLVTFQFKEVYIELLEYDGTAM